MDEYILVPYDGSPAAREALRYVTDRFSGARLALLYVMDPMADYGRQRAFPGYTGEDEFKNEREKGDQLLASAREDLPDEIAVETSLAAGNPDRAIIEYADEHEVDHIVIGSHGRSGVARYLLGSTAEKVVRGSAVPVTVIRPKE